MKLSQITDKIYTGQIISRVEAKEEVGDLVLETRKVLVPRAISNGHVNHADLGEVKLKKLVDEGRITQIGDIVLKLSTPYDAAYITENDTGLVVPSFCAVIREIDHMKADAKFILAYVNTGYIRNILKSKVAAITIPVIKLSDVKDLDLPPIPIEKQIMISKAYEISSQKRILLEELTRNDQVIIESLIREAVRKTYE